MLKDIFKAGIRVLINTIKKYENVKITNNGKYIVKIRFCNIVIVGTTSQLVNEFSKVVG